MRRGPRSRNECHTWTPEMVAALKRLTASGFTARETANRINRRFGTNVTRSAVIGKAARLYVERPAFKWVVGHDGEAIATHPTSKQEAVRIAHERLNLDLPWGETPYSLEEVSRMTHRCTDAGAWVTA